MKGAEGVYFRHEDYAPFWVRVLVDVLDFLVFGALCVALIVPLLMVFPSGRSTARAIFLTWGVIAFLYFAVLKRSSFRTLGYRAGRVRIVGLDGRRPSYWSLIVRFMFGMLGPLNWPIDLIWLTNDVHRQALRDKFANTYVVRATAQSGGVGRIVFRQYDILFYNFLFREVEIGPEPDHLGMRQ